MEKRPPSYQQRNESIDDVATQPQRSRRNKLFSLARFFISLVVAVFAGLFLFAPGFADTLNATIINVGLDLQRAQLISALLIACGAALLGSFVGRSKSGAWLGASLAFGFDYLRPFIQQQIQPFFDPAGNLEPLDTTVLTHTSFVLASLGLLAAFVGAAVGASLAEALLDQIVALLYFLWQRLMKNKNVNVPTRPLYRSPWNPGGWLATLGILVLIFFASSSVDLFIFSPDINIHSKPFFKTVGTVLIGSYISPALHNQRRSFDIYLPASYNTPAGAHRRYPVLMLFMVRLASPTIGLWQENRTKMQMR